MGSESDMTPRLNNSRAYLGNIKLPFPVFPSSILILCHNTHTLLPLSPHFFRSLPQIALRMNKLFIIIDKDSLESKVQFSCSVMSDSLWPCGLHHTRPPCPSPTPGVYSNSCPLSQWCHPTISSPVIPFSCLQSFPASGSFPMSQFFASDGQSIGTSASALVLPVNIQDWCPLGWTGWISLQSKGLQGNQTSPS